MEAENDEFQKASPLNMGSMFRFQAVPFFRGGGGYTRDY